MKWQILELDPDQVKQFAERYQVSPLAAQVFLRRGITRAEDLRWHLDGNIRSMHNPFLFNDMENAVERLNQAIAEQEKVMVFGDRDADGITSVALVVRKLAQLGLAAQWRLPMENSHYGLSAEGVRQAAADGVTLIVTVDCGITNLDEIDLAVEAGIDVIVIDHHNPQDELPAAVAIINPKLEGEGYPFAGLSAAALAAKVNWALDFSRSPLFGEEQCLINVRPGNDCLVFEALLLRNMVEIARLSETVVSADPSVLQNRILPFIQGQPLFLYDKKSQMPLLRQLFGERTDIFVTDLAEETWRTFPELKDRSLLRMIPGSRLSRFGSKPPLEIDVLKHLALALFQARVKAVYQAQDEDLAVVTLSLVADMMPMADENRIAVRRGLENLQNLKKGGLHALLLELGLIQPPLALRDIGWRITPVINSAGRMGKPDVALRLLLSDDPSASHALVRELVALNDERKKHGDQAWKRVASVVRESLETYGGKFVLVRDDAINRGITGILAGRIARDFDTPAMVLAQVDDNLVGSIRSARGLNVTAFLARFEDLLGDWGGHDAAGGFYVPRARYDEFLARFGEVVAGLDLTAPEEPHYQVDVLLSKEEMVESIWKVEETFLPSGQESPPVLYCVRGATIRAANPIGKEQQHVRLTLDTGQRQWPAVFWDAADRLQRDFSPNDRVDVLFKLERNNWNQTSVLQLNIVDVARA